MKRSLKGNAGKAAAVLLAAGLLSGLLAGCGGPQTEQTGEIPWSVGTFSGSDAESGSDSTSAAKPAATEEPAVTEGPAVPEATEIPTAGPEVPEDLLPEEPTPPLPEEQSSLLSAEDAAAVLMEIYDGREFTEELDLSAHPGLLSNADVTGPFLMIRKEGGSRFVPDLVGSDIVDNPELPEGAEIVAADAAAFPMEYIPLIQTDEKMSEAASGKRPIVYALLEYTGYGNAGDYNNGNFTLYYHQSRVSFYSLDTGEMVGWMKTSRSRSGPYMLMTNQYANDGQRPVYKFPDGSIWTDEAWSKALDELFYDENGYQVIGNKLLSVPEEIDTIVVPDGVTEIAADCGAGTDASKLIIPEGVRKIGYQAFYGSEIEEVQFPSTLRYCDAMVLGSTPWQEIRSMDGWVIVGDGVLLYCYSEEEDLVIPEEVRFIAPDALSGLPAKTVTIPSTVIQCCGSLEEDHAAAISYMEDLKKIVFKGGLSEALSGIPLSTFVFCDNMKTVVIDCETGELPDGWINNYVPYEELEFICPDDSEAARWADSWGIQHREEE